MKLAVKQLSGYLKDPRAQSQGILIYGPDEGQVREHARSILKAVVEDPKDAFAVEEFTEAALKDDVAKLSDALFAMNMMGSGRAVWLEADSDKIGKFVKEIYDGEQKPEAFLIVVAGELTPRSAMRSLFEGHKSMHALPCYRDEGYSLNNVISGHFREEGIRITPEVVDYLAANLGNDRSVTRAELAKISLYLGEEKELGLDAAMELVGNRSELSMDDFATALADGNWRDAERVGQRLLREAVEPIQIIRAFQRYFHRLHLMKATMLQTRQSADQVIGDAKPKVFFRLVPVLRRQLMSWELHALEQALQVLTKAEMGAKETGANTASILQDAIFQILTIYHRARRAAMSSNTAA